MSVASNLYAANVYSEHPIAVWPLDDDVSFLSLISNTNRDFANWTKTNCSANSSPTLPDIASPFIGGTYYGITGAVPASNGTDIELISPAIFTFEDLSTGLETFSLNFYLYQDSIYVNYYEIGFKYYDNFETQDIEIIRTVTAYPQKSWLNFNYTFEVPEFDSDSCYLIIRANVNTGGVAGDYNFIVNGLSVGQWSETTSSKSLGAYKTSIPTSASITLEGVAADQYGVLSDNAYYLVDVDNSLLAKNEGIPMVYGSENITKLYSPADNSSPSLIFPGNGMFSESGRYSNYSLEFWLRIYPDTKERRRILGPLDNDYGIYVSEGFITLVVGNNIASHNVSDWYRPMLAHLIIANDVVQLFINGEQVIEVSYNRSTISLTSSNEWWGFYSYNDIKLFEIDCISIVPYVIPLQVAKRRFVWGQGVELAEIVDAGYQGRNASISFPNAKYTANKIYPDVERWDAGYFNNLTATTRSISVPSYSLPNIYLSGRDSQEWYADNLIVNNLEYPGGYYEYEYYYNPVFGHAKFFTFRPNLNESGTQWVTSGSNWTEQCYLNFPTMSFLSNPTSAMYGIFEVDQEINISRPLIHIVNSLTGKRFEININGFEVTYNFDGTELYSETVGTSHFCVGFHIPTISTEFSYELSTFFGSQEFLQIYVGGNGTTTFEGKIYRIGFADSTNYNKIADHFDNNGIVLFDSDALLEQHYATYTLMPFNQYNRFFLDISVAATWEEYFPLSFFASYVRDRNGNRYYDLDYLQINFGYPSLIEEIETFIQNPGWTYQELDEEYAVPVHKSYEILDNSNITGYTNYNDLATNSVISTEINTLNSSMDAYVTFQLLSEGADEPLDNFPYSKELTDSFYVDAAAENTNASPYKAYKTKFSVVDGTIVYPPKNISFEDVAIVVHFNIEQDSILSSPLKIRSLEIASKALNQTGLTPIGTESGLDIYPYTKTGIYYDGKVNNPVLIYKENTPYLYLTKNSGIKVVKNFDGKEYGVIVPINPSKEINYSSGIIQLWAKYDLNEFQGVPVPIFNIEYKDGVLEFVIIADSTARRGIIYARDQLTKETYTNIVYYQNGIEVKNPTIIKDEWNSIGFTFLQPLDYSQYTGSIQLFSGLTYNNISVYNSSGLNEYSYIVPRVWNKVLFDAEIDPSNNLTWEYWYDEGGASEIKEWKNVYILAEDISFAIRPSDIYSSYIGTNIAVVDDNTGLSIIEDDFSIFADTSWLTYSAKPV